ncbi:hypothetical protein TUM12370_19860 [Salmonella enterica subsp. enterica serovar Choleraesuis]|nr:hypothetical protein TUM12370_19860 [Salmonella enterica subsp. enterica serovar Choleraesuis]
MDATHTFNTNIFSMELLSTPLAATAAIVAIVAFIFGPLRKTLGCIFKYKKGHNNVLKEAGVPAFILNFFALSIPVRQLPSIGWMEKGCTLFFGLLLLSASGYLIPALAETLRTPADSTLLVWKRSGVSFYASESRTTEARAIAAPRWTMTKENCQPENKPLPLSQQVAIYDYKEDLCQLLTTEEGLDYIKKSVKNFDKDRLFIYSIVPVVELFLMWLTLGFIFSCHYSVKVRRFILAEQKKAIECVKGEFEPAGIYSVYLELESENKLRTAKRGTPSDQGSNRG